MPYIYSEPSSPETPSPMPRTMLLTKRLTVFLNSNTSAHLHSLLLITPTGKLLSTSSPLPASILRTQATLACSLWSQYTSSQPATELISAALPQAEAEAGSGPDGQRSQEISSIMIQLEYGIMVIQGLQSGLLFIAIGPSSSTSASRPQIHSPEPLSSPSANTENPDSHEHLLSSPLPGSLTVGSGGGSGAPSEVGSVGTSGSGTAASILGLKRQAEELGKWLDGKLEGFALGAGNLR